MIKALYIVSISFSCFLCWGESESTPNIVQKIINQQSEDKKNQQEIAEFKEILSQITAVSAHDSRKDDIVLSDRLSDFVSRKRTGTGIDPLAVILRFALIARINELLTDYNPDEMVFMNISPPGGKYPSGISPASIREPEIRKKYEEMLKTNNERREYHRKMRNLISLRCDLNRFQKWHLETFSSEELKTIACPIVDTLLTNKKTHEEWQKFLTSLIKQKVSKGK